MTKLQQERLNGIGGSDSPVVLGVSPFKDLKTLWLEKRGLIPEPAPTPAMLRGLQLEPVVGRIYQEVTGRKIRRRKKILRDKEYPFIIGHIDCEIVSEDERGPGVLEIKVPGLRVFAECKRKGLLPYYYVQLQHYLRVTGRQWGALAIFNAERWELLHFDVDRSEETIELIVKKSAEFWRLVQEGIAPEDYYLCTCPIGPEVEIPDGLRSCEVVRLDDDADFLKAIRELREAKEILNEAQALYDAAVEQIQQIMGERGVDAAEADGVRIYWRETKGRVSYDIKRAIAEHPEIDWDRYKKVGAPTRPFRPYFLKPTAYE